MNDYLRLLQSYCDTLVRTQILSDDSNFHGAVPCPACHLLHGRVVDTVYPLTVLWCKTGEARYLTAACNAVNFAEHNLVGKRGEYYNDALTDWEGPTVFAAVALGETLFYHEDALPIAVKEQWQTVFRRLAAFIRVRFFEADFSANINYFATAAAAMAVAYRLLGEESFRDAAYLHAKKVRGFFTRNHILTGEGSGVSPKGFRAVDIGYNVEESLPSLTLFALLLEDEEWLDFTTHAWYAHLDFLLPDGGWDNTFGSRQYKWTYYGSRTSDGCQTGLSLLAHRDPLLAEAAERNFRLLAACSQDGYLYGGPMYHEAGEAPCFHHALAHAKAVAALVEHDFVPEATVLLPRERAYGLRYFPDLDIAMVAKGKLRATVSAYDYAVRPEAAVGGGTLTMLYHMTYGPLFAATMAKYTRYEELNMQLPRGPVSCGTVRIEADGLSSVFALDAVLTKEETEEAVLLSATGCLQNQRRTEKGASYTLTYRFAEEGMIFTAACDRDAILYLPVVCSKASTLTVLGREAVVSNKKATVSLRSDGVFLCENPNERFFNPVGGFLYADLRLSLAAGKTVTVTLQA